MAFDEKVMDAVDMQQQDIDQNLSSGAYMLRIRGTITAISDDKVVISTESGEVETDCSALKYDGKYPRYFVPGIEVVAYYFPDERNEDGLIRIEQVWPQSHVDEMTERNGSSAND